MAAPIGPGDWVECIKTAPGSAELLGRVYQVSEVGDWKGQAFINLRGLHKPERFPGWAAICFRPIYRPRAGAFDHLKAPPIRIREDA